MKLSRSTIEPNRYFGTVVDVAGNTLTTTCGSGLQHVHTLAADAEVTCHGQRCKLTDVTVGTRVRITANDHDEGVATLVECLRIPGAT